MLAVARQLSAGEHLLKQPFALKERLAAHIFRSKEEEVEYAVLQPCLFITHRVLQQLEVRPPFRIERHQLPVYDTRLHNGAQRLCDGGVPGRHLNALREKSRTEPRFTSAMSRKPSHLVSYTHSVLSNGLSASVASIGRYSLFILLLDVRLHQPRLAS